MTSRPHSTPAASWTHRTLVTRVAFGGRGRLMLLAAGGLIVHDVAEALVPVLVGVVIDRAVLPQDGAALALWLTVFAGLFVILTFSWRIAARVLVRVSGHGAHDLRLLTVQRVLAPRGAIRERPPGEVLSITTSDTSRVAALAWVVGEQAAALAAVVTASVALLVISVPLGLTVLLAAPVVVAIMHVVARPLEGRSHSEQAHAARAGALAADAVTGLRVLKGIGGEAAASRRYRGVSRESLDAALRAVRAHAAFLSAGEVVSGVFLAGIALFGATMAADGRIGIGEFVAVIGLAQFVYGPIRRLSALGVELAQRRASVRRITDVVAEPYALPAGDGSAMSQADAAVGPGSVVLDVRRAPSGVGTRFRVDAGELVGLVIPDGAAAAALVDVLGFRRAAERGDVTVCGIDLADLGPAHGRRLILSAPHDAPLVTATVARNIDPVGDPPQPRSEIVAATAVDDVLTHLDDGLDSMLSDQGRELSGGQRQRIALARALQCGHAVVVLHEPTSAVDSVTESRIAASLRDVTSAGVVLVTCSPAWLAQCDRVVVLDGGRSASGTHGELVADPSYRALVGAHAGRSE